MGYQHQESQKRISCSLIKGSSVSGYQQPLHYDCHVDVNGMDATCLLYFREPRDNIRGSLGGTPSMLDPPARTELIKLGHHGTMMSAVTLPRAARYTVNSELLACLETPSRLRLSTPPCNCTLPLRRFRRSSIPPLNCEIRSRSGMVYCSRSRSRI